MLNSVSAQMATGMARSIEKNRVLSQLLNSGPDFLQSRLHFVHLGSDETIYNDGDRVNCVYFPLDSVVSSLAVLKDGASVEIAMYGHDSMVGLTNVFGPRANQYWTRMCIGGRLAKLDIEDLIVAFSESKQVSKIILKSYTALLSQISQRSVCNAKHSVMQRFSSWLLMVHDRVSDGSFRLTQELVASRLGTRRAGITVAARLLLDEKAVEYKRGLLKIKDREIIERHACECYPLVSARTDSEVQPVLSPAQTTRSVVLPIDPNRRYVPGRVGGA